MSRFLEEVEIGLKEPASQNCVNLGGSQAGHICIVSALSRCRVAGGMSMKTVQFLGGVEIRLVGGLPDKTLQFLGIVE